MARTDPNVSNDGQVSPLMHELSGYMAGAMKRKLPAEVTERAKLHLVDMFAAMIAGSRLLPGKRAIAYVKPLGATREAGVIGTRIVTSALNAALANGMCGHADEIDDMHPLARGHPGACIIPATLAMAERQQSTGESILRALVLGYDVGMRVLLALKQIQQPGHHPSPKGGLCGSAAAAGALLKLDARKVRYMLSYCAQQAAGLFTQLRDIQHIEKAYEQGGMPAHNGVAAAQMVASGFTGVEDVLSGEPNFLSVFSPQADYDAVAQGLGRDYEILRSAIKYWPAAASIQGPLHVLRDLMQRHEFKAHDVDKLIARMPDKDLKNVDNRDMPDITVQHLLAVMLLDGGLTFATAHDYARMKDPRVLELRQNHIQTIGEAHLMDPMRRWRCVMEITLNDGRKLNHEAMAAKGGVGNPLTRLEVEAKALDLMGPTLGKKRSRTLMSALFNIEGIKNARALRRLYAA